MDLQDHEGNEVVDHAENDGKARVDHRHGTDAKPRQDGVEHALILQNAHPRIGAHQHIDPGGHGDEQDEDGVAAAAALGDDIGDGVAQHDADERCADGNVKRAQQHIHKDRVRDEAGKVIKGELEREHGVAGGRKRVEHDQDHRHDDDRTDPRDIRVGHGTKALHHWPSFFIT